MLRCLIGYLEIVPESPEAFQSCSLVTPTNETSPGSHRNLETSARTEDSNTGIHGTLYICFTLFTLSMIILATVIGNVMVVIAVVIEKNLRNVSNYLTASLAIADLMVALLVMPLAAVNQVDFDFI